MHSFVKNTRNLISDDELVAVKDKELRYTFATKQLIQKLGLNNEDELHGKTDDTLTCNFKDLAKSTKIIDKRVMKFKRPITCCVLLNFVDKAGLFINYKAPIEMNKEVIGVKDTYLPFINRGLLYDMMPNSKTPDPNSKIPKLTEHEHLIVFLLICNFNPKEIVHFMDKHVGYKLNSKTISNVIYNQLYKKFAVDNLADLTRTALQHNINEKIPKLLHKIQLITVID